MTHRMRQEIKVIHVIHKTWSWYLSCSFRQWVHTDSTTLVTLELTISEFVDALMEKMKKLTTHHYTAKALAAFIRKSKDDLKESTAVILLDFSENFSFIIQDAVQGFHWNNSQVNSYIQIIILLSRSHDLQTNLFFSGPLFILLLLIARKEVDWRAIPFVSSLVDWNTKRPLFISSRGYSLTKWKRECLS